MLRSLAFAIVAFSVSAGAAPAFAQPQPPPQPPPTIVTQGQAVLRRAPDRAWLTIATQVRESKANDARRKSNETMTEIHNALKGVGVRDEAIRTTGYSLTPEMDSRTRNVTGYFVRNQIEVRVDDLERLGDIMDAANGPKSSGLSIIGPRFDLKNEQAAQAEALKLAVENAITRAQAIAAGARRTLGPVLRIDDQGLNTIVPRPMARTAMAPGAAGRGGGEPLMPETPIEPGEIEIRAQVTLTIAIQ
ncbi:MAG TPA: SIMPL domain-containing protein [Vicinamibacterales bacterium]|nr:SIMPL domain-containing protein [Vicinamibacterales bacterium]